MIAYLDHIHERIQVLAKGVPVRDLPEWPDKGIIRSSYSKAGFFIGAKGAGPLEVIVSQRGPETGIEFEQIGKFTVSSPSGEFSINHPHLLTYDESPSFQTEDKEVTIVAYLSEPVPHDGRRYLHLQTDRPFYQVQTFDPPPLDIPDEPEIAEGPEDLELDAPSEEEDPVMETIDEPAEDALHQDDESPEEDSEDSPDIQRLDTDYDEHESGQAVDK